LLEVADVGLGSLAVDDEDEEMSATALTATNGDELRLK
jgi:hypothetical protein